SRSAARTPARAEGATPSPCSRSPNTYERCTSSSWRLPSCCSERREDPVHRRVERHVEGKEIEAEERRRDDHDHRRRVDLLARGPCDAAHLVAHLGQEAAAVLPPAHDAAATVGGANRGRFYLLDAAHNASLRLPSPSAVRLRASRFGATI